MTHKLSNKAEDDLDRIYEYGLLHHGLEDADQYYDGLIERLEKLGESPYQYPAVDHIRTGYRLSVYGVNSIYYRIEQDRNRVLIVRVLGRQNPTKSL